MVKTETTDKDSTEKKRRKTSSTDKLSKEECYEIIIANEEKEAFEGDAKKDIDLFITTCESLKKCFKEIAALKKDGSEKAKNEITEKRIQGSLLFVTLKKLNRLDKIRARAGRDSLQKEKLRVDSNRLQLQNLLYEANHLKREVQRCYQFKSQDEEIELINEKEFYKTAPETISRPEKTKNDEHVRRLARLEWELHQRKELSAKCKELTVSKETAANDIASKSERLNSLAPCLEALLKATRPLQTALNMEFEKEWVAQKSARLLPRPLYLAYANLCAYTEACEKNLKATIDGDEEEAKCLDDGEFDNGQSQHPPEDEDYPESDTEENDGSNHKKHHKRQSKAESLESRRKALLTPHPLTVTFTIKNSNDDVALSICLRYYPSLGFVTGLAKTNVEPSGVAASDVISSENILKCLYPNDFGDVSPNPKTVYQLNEYKMAEKDLLEYFAAQNSGKPFIWLQKLCGLDFVSLSLQANVSGSEPSTEISRQLAHDSIPQIIKLIKARWHSRISLYKQILALESINIDTLLHSDEEETPVRISSSLVQWIALAYDDYVASACTEKFTEENLVKEYDLFYQAIINRGSAKLECFVCVSVNFPDETPLWGMSLNWNGRKDASNDSTIREMEYWVNNFETHRSSNLNILSKQLKRAMSCLDIFLETEGPLYNPAEFTQDKTFFKAFRGRQRARPIKVVQSGGCSIFKQI